MKKSFYILLLIFEFFLVFLTNNTSTLLKAIQSRECKNILIESKQISKLMLPVNNPGKIKSLMKNNSYFDNIYITKKSPEESVIYGKNNAYTLFIKKIETGFLIFRKNSKLLYDLEKLKRVSDSLGIVFVFFLILTGIIFLVKLRKKPKKSSDLSIPDPFKKYIDNLQQSESNLKNSLSVQQKEILSKETLNKNIIDNINISIILVNEFNRIIIFNNTAQIMFNCSFVKAKNELIQNVFKEHPDLASFSVKTNSKTTSEISSNNSIFLIDFLPITNEGKLIIIKDITQEKIKKRVSDKVNNFAMMGEMSSYLSHEIRNSLGVIYGYSKTLDKSNSKVLHINQEIEHLSDMISKFLKFSKPFEIKKKEKISLSSFIESISKEVKMTVKITEDSLHAIHSDKTLLKSAFTNLFLNSKQAGADSLSVLIERLDNSNIQILFSDNGSGIDLKNIDKIWFPFFTTKEDGSGMGLPIVRKIITILNGEIDLIDHNKTGTHFKILFYKT